MMTVFCASKLLAEDEAVGLAVDKFAAAAAAAEAGFRAAVKALSELDQLAAYIQRTVGGYNYHVFKGEVKPAAIPEIQAISSMTLRMRISERILQTLNPLSPENGNYGRLQWAVLGARSDEDWATEERRLIEGDLSLSRRTIAQQIREYETASRSE